MRYRNKITGNVLVTECKITSADFELIDEPKEAPKEEKASTVKEAKPKTTTTAKRAKK